MAWNKNYAAKKNSVNLLRGTYKRMAKMNAWQEKICGWFANIYQNLIVRARAGTGKTTTIMEAIFYIEAGRKVLLVAFNKKIELELSRRLQMCEGMLKAIVEAKTSHSLGLMFLKMAWPKVDMFSADGKRAMWQRGQWIARTVLGSKATDILVKKIDQLASLGKGVCPFGTVEDLVKVALDYNVTPDSLSDYTVVEFAQWAKECMELAKSQTTTVWFRNGQTWTSGTIQNVINFDDMIFIPLTCGYVRPMFNDIVVDEAQDFNEGQIQLILRACINNPATAGKF